MTQMLEKMPSWAQLAISMGTILFMSGAAYSSITNNSSEIDRLAKKLEKQADDLNGLKTDVAVTRSIVEQIDKKLDK